MILTDTAFCTQTVLNRHAKSPESLDLQGVPGLSFLLTLGAGMFYRNFLFRLFREKGGFFRLFCMAVLLCSKKCKPAWRNDLAINIKLTAVLIVSKMLMGWVSFMGGITTSHHECTAEKSID